MIPYLLKVISIFSNTFLIPIPSHLNLNAYVNITFYSIFLPAPHRFYLVARSTNRQGRAISKWVVPNAAPSLCAVLQKNLRSAPFLCAWQCLSFSMPLFLCNHMTHCTSCSMKRRTAVFLMLCLSVGGLHILFGQFSASQSKASQRRRQHGGLGNKKTWGGK